MKRAIVVLALVACSKDKAKEPEKHPEPPKTEPAPPPPPKRVETTAAAFGKTPAATFGKIAKLKLGMSAADAKAAAPEFFDGDKPKTVDAPEDALAFTPVVEFGRLVRIEIKSTSYTNLEPLLKTAWGEGKVNKNVLGGDQMFWFDPATHTRARADSSDLELAEYMPLAEMLGPDKDKIAALPKPVLDVPVAQLKADYGDKMKADDNLLHIYLPPAEWDREYVSVFVLSSDRKKKTTDYSMELLDDDTPAARDAALAIFEAKWGKPRMLKSYGATDETMVFHARNPLVEVQRTVDKKSWRLSVRPKDDACGGPCFKGL